MRHSITPLQQSSFPFLSVLPNLMTFLSGQGSQNMIETSSNPFYANTNPYFDRNQTTSSTFDKSNSKGMSDCEIINDIKREEITTKKEDITSYKDNRLSFQPDDKLAEVKMANIWLEMLRHWKMFNPMMDYSMMNGLMMHHANFMREFSTFAANLQFLQKNNEINTTIKNQTVKKTEKINGIYNKEERMRKIQYYKEKKNKWRAKHPINRGFLGRKMVAKAKPRIRGKFVKKSIYDDFKVVKP